MKSDYAACYRNLYENHWWWRAREKVLIKTIGQCFPQSENLRILDIGCGDGLFFKALSRFGTVDGIEHDEHIVSCRNRSNGKIMVCDFLQAFDSDSAYDLILMLDVIEHVKRDDRFLAKAKSLLRPGGKIIVTVPAFNALWTAHDDANEHFRRYTISALAQIAGKCSLRVEWARYFFSWLGFTKLLVRFKERFVKKQASLPAIPGNLINQLLIRISWLEFLCLRCFPFPFGSSLISVLVPDTSSEVRMGRA